MRSRVKTKFMLYFPKIVNYINNILQIGFTYKLSYVYFYIKHISKNSFGEFI